MKKLNIALGVTVAILLIANVITLILLLGKTPDSKEDFSDIGGAKSDLTSSDKANNSVSSDNGNASGNSDNGVSDSASNSDNGINSANNSDSSNIGVSDIVIPNSDEYKPVPATGSYNYGEALQKSLLFYELQRSGELPASTRSNWRGNSGLNDGADVGLDLTGGWYDAGDHVKFNLPMAYTSTLLAWSVEQDKESYLASGQLEYILGSVKWANDYFIKCHPEKEVYYYQVGNGNTDHSWWGPAEAMQMERPSYKVDKNNPGSTVVAGTSASLAACAVVFSDYDKSYSELCLKHAKELFDFAESTKSDSGYTAASGFYQSWSGFNDELGMAAYWLYKATGDKAYLDKAKSYIDQSANGDYYTWAHCWDNQTAGAALLIAMETGDSKYKGYIEKNLDFWAGLSSEKIGYTPKGLAWLDSWGALRYSTTMAFLASSYSQYSGCPSDKVKPYWDFAVSQVDYALGSSGRSFVCGFGENYPLNPHHRTAQGSWSDNMNVPSPGRHVLIGALVGGPDKSDNYKDQVSDYVSNEVACDYNAGFTGALAKMYNVYGGAVIPNLTANETVPVGEELFVEACVNASGNNFLEIKAVVYNQTGYPARVTDNLKLRYYIDVSECGANAITLNGNYMQGGKVSELKQYKDNIYYVEIDFSGYKIYPGGQSQYKCEVQFRMTSSGEWDNGNDPSYNGVGASGNLQKAEGIALFEGSKLVFGATP